MDEWVLGYDPGQTVAWTAIDQTGRVVFHRAHRWTTVGDLFRICMNVLRSHPNITRVSIEEIPATMTGRVLLPGKSAAIMELAAEYVGIPVTHWNPSTSNKAVVGHGRPGRRVVRASLRIYIGRERMQWHEVSALVVALAEAGLRGRAPEK